MVGARRKWLAVAAMPAQHDKLNNRLRAQRRTVQASGSRAGSLQCGARLLGRGSAADSFASLFSTTKSVLAKRDQPVGQHGERISASTAYAAPNPDTLMRLIVCLSKSSPVADDRVRFTNRTPPR
jgi:hypothetical protein